MIQPFAQLKASHLLHQPGASCLDIGTREGAYAEIFAKHGYEVHAIDMKPLGHTPAHYTFEVANIESYVPERTYDLVFARNVLPFTKDPLMVLRKLPTFLSHNGVLLVTLFGHDDPWAADGKIRPVTFEDALKVLEEFSELEKILWSTSHEYGHLLNSDEIKLWHIHSFICRKKNQPTEP